MKTFWLTLGLFVAVLASAGIVALPEIYVCSMLSDQGRDDLAWLAFGVWLLLVSVLASALIAICEKRARP